MASSTQVHYRNLGESASGNRRPNHFNLPALVEASTLRRHLRPTVKYFLKFDRFGTELWASTKSIAVACGVHRNTIQRNVDELLRELFDCEMCSHRDTLNGEGHCRKCNSDKVTGTGLRIFEEVCPANTWVRYGGSTRFRRSATYKLNPFALRPRKTYEQYRAERDAKRVQYVGPSPGKPEPPEPSQSQPAAPDASFPASPPAAPRQPSTHRSPSRPVRALSPRETGKLMAMMAQLMKGFTRIQPPEGGIGTPLEPSDPYYQKPFGKYDAMLEACKRLGLPIEAAVNTLVASGHKIAPESDA